ncbi:hypothetical protein Rhopal_004526-T1 [Rhodotorula paludigena]|uniref:Protein CPL1-like domain-containing protein n=1 Tax=Rhodotorula paludigena TaxID=86838 RepID=A0AAV5GMS9_9BASI|nr:hypothetical protein Rhopal_004526-T1 [Rhodotorula paludigena]
MFGWRVCLGWLDQHNEQLDEQHDICVFHLVQHNTKSASSASSTADPSASSSSASTTTTSSPSSSATSSTSEAADTISAQQIPAASASARARAKRAMVPPTSNRLCPDNLTACPIESSSFATARDGSSFETLRALVFAASTPPAAGPSLPLAERKAIRSGFECVDTRFETESCGGCASLGEGLNCAEDVPHARSTGCEEGRCVVFTCEKGWKPNPSARACVRVHDAGRKRGHRRGQRRLSH